MQAGPPLEVFCKSRQLSITIINPYPEATILSRFVVL